MSYSNGCRSQAGAKAPEGCIARPQATLPPPLHAASPDDDPARRAAQHAAQQEEALRQQGMSESAPSILAAAAAAEDPGATGPTPTSEDAANTSKESIKAADTARDGGASDEDLDASTVGDQASVAGPASLAAELDSALDATKTKLNLTEAPSEAAAAQQQQQQQQVTFALPHL